MKTLQVVLNAKGLSLPELAVYGQSIATALNKNGNFPNLYPDQKTLQSAVDALNEAIAAARPGDKASTAATHAAEAELNRILKALTAHVEFESNNDDTVALSSGFSLKQPGQAVAHVFEAEHGHHSGTVDLKSPRHANASFIWQVTPDPLTTAGWQTVATTMQASYTVPGLTPGSRYWFRVATVTKDGQQPFSDPLQLLVV